LYVISKGMCAQCTFYSSSCSHHKISLFFSFSSANVLKVYMQCINNFTLISFPNWKTIDNKYLFWFYARCPEKKRKKCKRIFFLRAYIRVCRAELCEDTEEVKICCRCWKGMFNWTNFHSTRSIPNVCRLLKL
jgi:hypothetical protein